MFVKGKFTDVSWCPVCMCVCILNTCMYTHTHMRTFPPKKTLVKMCRFLSHVSFLM